MSFLNFGLFNLALAFKLQIVSVIHLHLRRFDIIRSQE